MPTYVDTSRNPFRRMVMCHMMADTLDELHHMAQSIGIKREFFQNTRSGPHYDVSLSKKELALKLGAILISQREMAAFAWHMRSFGFPFPPKEAHTLMVLSLRSKARKVVDI